ncbi:UDP-glucose 6-dehydrogenase [Pasteurellaceae bacterium LFhippo2]|nr:UDP-glucose 6-dehydrogenase [Pasteurellaceae bacterium LFhippo2]
MNKITIVGAGYVGLANAVLLAQYNKVTIVDINTEKVSQINQCISPIVDPEIQDYLTGVKDNLFATIENQKAFSDADFILVATPTNYDPALNTFNTESVESVVSEILSVNSTACIIIKSTIPVGFTENLRKKFNSNNIIFSPEFLREGKALYDNLYPTRIIIGDSSDKAKIFTQLLQQAAIKKNIPTLFVSNSDAEAIKLFSNTYLAMRVAYFNELDSYAMTHNLNTKNIILGVGLDERIGTHYNNPSFGYGGYCLPKDSKQLLSNFNGTPQNLIKAIVESNETRKKFIADSILKSAPQRIGIYRLVMKDNSDNYRESAILDLIRILKEYSVDIMIYEPYIKDDSFNGIKINNDLSNFKQNSDIIIANRLSAELDDVMFKVYSRDMLRTDI